MMEKLLEGVRVLDFTLAGSGPSCTKLLTEFGAEDIWVEPLQGTSTRSVHKYDFYSAGKKALAVNLKTPEGQEILRRLLLDADVFVSNYRPAAIEKLGLSYEKVREINPGIIYATLTGFGEEGEKKNNPGYDSMAFWSEAGLLRDIAEAGTLVVPPIAVGDITTGMGLAYGIAAALFRRERTGEGCHVFTSLLAMGIYLNHDAIIETQYGEKYPKSRKKPYKAMYNTYRARDGEWFALGIPAELGRYFDKIMYLIGREDLVGSPRFSTIRDTMGEKGEELVRILDEGFKKMDRQEILDRLLELDVPASAIQSSEDVLTDPQALANGYLFRREATVPPSEERKDILIPASPVKVDSPASGTENHGPGPVVGQDNDTVLRECGFSKKEIFAMRMAGAIL